MAIGLRYYSIRMKLNDVIKDIDTEQIILENIIQLPHELKQKILIYTGDILDKTGIIIANDIYNKKSWVK